MDVDQKPQYLLIVIHDVTERTRAEARIAHMAHHDSLTDLPNRAAFNERLAAALEKENLFVRKYYSPPCHHLTAYSSAIGQTLPRTEASAYSVVALPVYNDMTAVECDGISRAFTEIHRATPRLARAAF